MNGYLGWSTNRLYRFCLVLTLLISLALIKPVPPVFACTPPLGGHPIYSVTERTNAAEVVLEGTVTNLTDPFYGTATVEVNRYFKGSGPATVTITDLGTTALCLSPVSVGSHYIFYTVGSPSTGLKANYLGAFDAVDPADPQIIAEIIAAVGHDPVPPSYQVYLPIILK